MFADKQEATRALGQWLSENVDSHDCYALGIFDNLPDGWSFSESQEMLSCEIAHHDDKLVLSYRIPVQSAASLFGEMQRDPRGGSMDRDAIKNRTMMVVGYRLSGSMCRQMVGDCIGDQMFGRGSAHRAHIKTMQAPSSAELEAIQTFNEAHDYNPA